MNQEQNRAESKSSLENRREQETLPAMITREIKAARTFSGENGLMEVLDKLSKDELVLKEESGITAVTLTAHIALIHKLVTALESKKYSEEEIKETYTDPFMFTYGLRKKVDELIEDWYRNNLDIDLTAL